MKLILIISCSVFWSHPVKSTSFVPSIGHQWPWSQWTTTESSSPSGGGGPYTVEDNSWRRTTTEHPPPPVTWVPPRQSESTDYIIAKDPNDGRTFYIPVDTFYQFFGGRDESGPRNPFICDLYSTNCWLPTTSPTQKSTPRISSYWRPSTTPSPQIPQQRISSFYRPSMGNRNSLTENNKVQQFETDELETGASNWNSIPSFYGGQSRVIYRPEESKVNNYPSDNNYNQYYHHTYPIKRKVGSGIGGTTICNKENCDENSTLKPLIRVTRPSIFKDEDDEK